MGEKNFFGNTIMKFKAHCGGKKKDETRHPWNDNMSLLLEKENFLISGFYHRGVLKLDDK